MRTVFLCTGQGSQYPRMGAGFARRFPEFADALAECDEHFRAHLPVSVADLLLADHLPDADGVRRGAAELLERTAYQQPALFAFEWSLARLWRSRGVTPDVVLGHSIGELVAVALAGVLALPDAVRLVAARGRLMQGVARAGAMVAVAAGADRVRPGLAELGSAAPAFAAFNAPDRCVLSGDPEAIAAAVRLLREHAIPHSALKVSHAFHSPLMAEAAAGLGPVAEELRFRPPTRTLISALTAAEPAPDMLAAPEFWMRHCLEPVNFAGALRAAAAEPSVFVELGPSHTLLKFGQRCAPDPDHRWLRSAAPGDDECREFDASARRLADSRTTPAV
ncbi:acyltransferase domain-containing protein [Nocardia sp. NPDC003482]